MKIPLHLITLLLLISFLSCEDVIDVDVPAENPRLIVDALILVDTTKSEVSIEIAAKTTSSFFGEITPTSLESLCLAEESGGQCIFPTLREAGTGIYEATVSPQTFTQNTDDQRWQLSFTHEDQRYLAFTDYVPTVAIDTLFEGDGDLFSGEETEVVVSFTDRPETRDFYLFDFDFNEYLVTEDEFYQGQPFQFSYFYEDGLESGTEVKIGILGVTRSFYDYMNQIIVQSSGDQGPFQTPAATVRGNIINVTEIDNIDFFDNVEQTNNFALGYFAICQTFEKSIVID